MKIYFASDLHFDVGAGAPATRLLAEYVAREATDDDVLILGGDYGNDDAVVEECLRCFDDVAATKLGVAGNHDVWVDPKTEDSWARYQRLSDLFRASGVHPLEDEPVVIAGVGFVGAMGWYDYSFRVPSLEVDLEVYERKGFPGTAGPIWNDGRFVRWGQTDPEFTEWQVARVTAQLEDTTGASRLVVATHHVPTEGLLRPSFLPATVPRESVVPEKWLILNTYLGSRRFEEALAPHAARIDIAFCGHIHLARETERRGIRFMSNGSDHKQKELIVVEDGRRQRISFAP